MRRAAVIAISLVLMLAMTAPAAAWGRLGHRLVAALAWNDLTPRTRAEIVALLAGEADPTLPGIASWADELRDNNPDLGKRSARWHYVNIAEHDCDYDVARACSSGDCVVAAIDTQAAILADRTQTKAARLQALKFVVHFVGDVHQPMHAGYARDLGGNKVQVHVPDELMSSKDGNGWGGNLHSLWDSRLLQTRGFDEGAYLQRLRALPLAISIGQGPAAWAESSCRIAVKAYPAKPRIDAAYIERWRPVAEAQLVRGGSHLADVLNTSLDRR